MVAFKSYQKLISLYEFLVLQGFLPVRYFYVRYIYLIRCFGVKYRRMFLQVVLYFDEPAGRVKI